MKIIPFVVAIAMFLGLEAVFNWPKFFYIFLVIGILAITFILRAIFSPGRKQRKLINKGFLYYLALSILFFVGVLLSLFFVKYGLLYYLISTISSILLFGFFYTLNKYFKAIKASILDFKDRAESLSENNFLSKIILFNIAAFFFVNSSLFGFIIFFRIPFWNLIPIIFVLNVFFVSQTFFAKGERILIYNKKNLVLGLLITQFFVILNYLPTTFLMASLFLTVFYGLSLFFVSRFFYACQTKNCRFYQILIGIIIILISLLTLRI